MCNLSSAMASSEGLEGVTRPTGGTALPFIQLTEEGFQVQSEASSVLDSITGKIAVVVVVGPYR